MEVVSDEPIHAADVDPEAAGEEIEVLDGLPVLAEVRAIETAPGPIPGLQAAAVASAGFFAGAMAMALVKRYAARKLAGTLPSIPVGPAARPVSPLRDWPVGTSRTYVVNVRLVSRPGE